MLIFERDRATYNPLLSSAVSYSVPSPTDAPESLTFGNTFMELAGNYDGAATIGLCPRFIFRSKSYSDAELHCPRDIFYCPNMLS